MKDTVNKQNIMLSNLNEMLVKGRKAMFGKSSEQLGNIDGSEQLTLFNEAEQESSAKADEPTVETVNVKSYPRRKRLETAIIERYRRRESSVEEALIEMYLCKAALCCEKRQGF